MRKVVALLFFTIVFPQEKTIELKDVMQNEITQCPDCGADLEVVNVEPLELALAPEEEEDWGE